MARDRQRAKQRKARRAQNPGPESRSIHRANVTGELEHASGDADEFEAALVAGAEGSEDESAEDADVAGESVLEAEHPEELSDEGFAELEDEVDELADEDEDEHAAPARRGRRRAPAAGAATGGGAGRFLAFLRASWAELQRVQWPDRRQVAQATAVVIGFVIVAGLYLGLADKVAQEVVDFIL